MAIQPNSRNATLWTIRIIPFFIFGAFGFAIYAVVAYQCVNYLYRQKRQHGTAVALIVLFFLTWFLTLAAYFRTFYCAQLNQGLVPLSERRKAVLDQRQSLPKKEQRDLEGQHDWQPADLNPDSPGLEAFYSKEVFVCEPDGRPRWCSLCWNWKPDRASHSSDLDRCVRKMDHLCPWVGGMVSETSFNFFIHFTFWCTWFLVICIASSGYCLKMQIDDGRSVDGRIVAILALAGLFCFFTTGMTITSGKFIFENITSVDMLRKDQQFHLAVRVPLDTPSTHKYWTITYPLPHPARVTYDVNGAPLVMRDDTARRTFAVLRTESGENPFDLGPWGNFKSVMGNNIFEWLLPIRESPCCDHDSMTSDYEFGPLVGKLRQRYQLPKLDPVEDRVDGIELRTTRNGRNL